MSTGAVAHGDNGADVLVAGGAHRLASGSAAGGHPGGFLHPATGPRNVPNLTVF